MIKQVCVVVAGAVVALGLAACGESPQVVQYKQGKYQGKPDQTPYEAAPFNGNKTEWERTIKTRNQSQNEYKRT
jgi:hypothetical protein